MPKTAPIPYRRILLKLSGEALLGKEDYGIDPAELARIADEIKQVVGLGLEVGVVIGGGNIFRGAGLARAGMDRVCSVAYPGEPGWQPIENHTIARL